MAEPPPPDLSGHGLRIGEILGEGATGVVYEGTDLETANRAVAIKLITSTEPYVLEALAREIDSIIKLRHPNVAILFRARTSAPPRYLVYELLDPAPDDLPLTDQRTAECGVKLCSGLAAAHRAGIVHCDIKPDNILWSRGEPLISDFGAARIDATTRFRHGIAFSPAWAAPWIRVVGPGGADPSSDVWSLAASLVSFNQRSDRYPVENLEDAPTALSGILREAMPAIPPSGPISPDHALELGRRLQEYQHGRGWAVTPFPDDGQEDWSIPRSTSRQRTTVAVAGPPSQPVDLRVVSASPGRRRRARWSLASLLGVVVLAVLAVTIRGALTSDPLGSAVTDASTVAIAETPAGVEASEPASPTVASTRSDDPGADSSVDEREAALDVELEPERPLESPIVFASDRRGNPDIYVLYPDGTVDTVLARDADDYAPSLSPDGSTIVFESNEGGPRAVFSAPIDGSSAPRQLSSGESEATSPSWSPDGRTIAWATRARSNWDIATYDLDRSVETLVTTATSDDLNPSWSPDGDELVFRSDRSGSGDIYRLELATQRLTQLTSNATIEDSPAWGAGGLVAFEVRVDGDVEVFTVDISSSTEIRRRTTRAGFDGSPTFDRDRLVIVRRDDTGSSLVMSPGVNESILETSAGLVTGLEGRSG